MYLIKANLFLESNFLDMDFHVKSANTITQIKSSCHMILMNLSRTSICVLDLLDFSLFPKVDFWGNPKPEI